jgi:spore germination protein YaaH
MKTYIKPVLIGIIGILLFAAGVIGVMNLYQQYLNSLVEEEPVFVETQVDFSTIYEDASIDNIVVLYNGTLVEDTRRPKMVDNLLFLPIDLVITYLNDQFFYDEVEKTITYTTREDIIRMKTNELTYTVNDEPLMLDIGVLDIEGTAYLPLSLVQKFSHHDYIFNEAYNTLKVADWYSPVKTGEVYFEDMDVYIRLLPDDLSTYLHKTYVGMSIEIVGEENEYYQVMTKEGFIGYIKKEYVRSVTSLYSNKEPLTSYRQFPPKEVEGKITIAWHQVFNMQANRQVAERFENVTNLDVISPTWFELTGVEGDVRSLADLDYVRWAHSKGYEVWALFGNLGEGYTKAMTHEVLSSTEKRAEAIRQVLALSVLYEVDGINIDFEAIPEADGIYFVQFVKELAIYARQQGLVSSADLPVVKSWTRHYGRKEIAEYLDYVIIMAYDEHWGSSPIAGSVSSKTFTDEGVFFTLQEVPKEKVILGVPFYTRLWKEETVDGKVKVSSKAYSMDGMQSIINENKVELVWLEDIGQYYGEYEKEGARYRIWMEEKKSMEMRMRIAQKYDVAGIAAWKIGLENQDIWPVIGSYMKPQ